MAIAASIPMIATTIINSIRVKPFCPFALTFIVLSSLIHSFSFFKSLITIRNMLPFTSFLFRFPPKITLLLFVIFQQVPCLMRGIGTLPRASVYYICLINKIHDGLTPFCLSILTAKNQKQALSTRHGSFSLFIRGFTGRRGKSNPTRPEQSKEILHLSLRIDRGIS